MAFRRDFESGASDVAPLLPVGAIVGAVTPVFDEQIVAAVVAAIVAWRLGNMLATIGVGMAVLWGVGFLLG